MKVLEKIIVRVREETGDVIDRSYDEVKNLKIVKGFLIIETSDKRISINIDNIREIEEIYVTVPDQQVNSPDDEEEEEVEETQIIDNDDDDDDGDPAKIFPSKVFPIWKKHVYTDQKIEELAKKMAKQHGIKEVQYSQMIKK